MAIWLGKNEKLCILIHFWKCFSPAKIINEEIILEGIHLQRDISMVCYNSTILKLIQIFRTL